MSAPEQDKDEPKTAPEEAIPDKLKGEISIAEGAAREAERVRHDRLQHEKKEGEPGGSK